MRPTRRPPTPRRPRRPAAPTALVPALLGLLAAAAPAAAQAPPEVPAPGDALYQVELGDGSEVVARVDGLSGDTVILATVGGADLRVGRSGIVSFRPAIGRVVDGEFWPRDPNGSRLFFTATARTLERGRGYVGSYLVALPFVAVGVTDRITLAGGAPVLFGELEPFWLAPKVQVVREESVQAAVGILAFVNDGETAGVGYGVATFGGPDRALTLGAGWGFAGSDVESEPVALVGGEARVGRRGKLLTENYLLPGGELLFSGGMRLIGGAPLHRHRRRGHRGGGGDGVLPPPPQLLLVDGRALSRRRRAGRGREAASRRHRAPAPSPPHPAGPSVDRPGPWVARDPWSRTHTWWPHSRNPADRRGLSQQHSEVAMRPASWAFARGALIAALTAGLVLPGLAAQETGRITGTVTSATNMRPLDGAQVWIEGTGMGALANDQGRYLLLNVPGGTYTVRVTMIGHSAATEQVTVVAGQAATVNFTLSETALALDELVVTGTAAEVRAKEVGNSLDAVTSREIQNSPVRHSEDILSGRAPGVTIMTNSGQPGAGGTVKIRGINTVSQTANPLIYVDGIRIFNDPVRASWNAHTSTSPLQDIPAEDIERIEVVKGAAATTLYGTEAAAGVIQIFTKRGISGDPVWTAEVGGGFNHLPSFLADDSQDPSDLYTRCGDRENLYSLNVQTSTSNPTWGDRQYLYDPTCPSDGDWQRLGGVQNYSLGVRGGAGDVTYYLSGTYNDTKGVLQTSRSRDGGFRGNFAFAPLDDLTFALNTSYTRRKTRWVPDGNNANGFLLNVGRGAQNYLKGGKGEDCANVPTAPDGSQPICITNGYLFESELFTQNDHFVTGFTTDWRPTDALSNRFSVGWDYVSIGSETTRPFGHLYTPAGYFWDENTRHTKLSLDYAGSFQNDFGRDLASTFSWGGQVFKDHHRWTEVDVDGFAGPGRPTIDSGAELTYRGEQNVSQTSAGFFLQELLGWQDRLFLTAGLRVDGNSAFGDDYGLQYYPKVSLSYILSDYDFWPSEWFETMKLRAAMGESGKAPGPFAGLRTWSGVGIEGEPGFTPGDPGNADVGPERTREYEVGFDASLWQGRLGVETTYFNAKTRDALVEVDLPSSEGFLLNRQENVGTLQNSGWEFQLTGGLLRTRSLDWRARANLSFLESEAIDLDGDADTDTCIYVGLNSEICEGFQIPMFKGNLITNPGAFADPVVASDTVIGPVYPTRLVGIGSTLRIGENLTLDALLEHQGGHYNQNYTGYQNARRGSWPACFDTQLKIIEKFRGNANALDGVTALERGRCGISSASGYPFDNFYWIEKADFWKLRSVTLAYEVPESLLSWGRSATVTLSARNLFMWTDYSGTDPEVQDFADQSGNVSEGGEFGRRDYYQIPNPRTYMLAVRLSW